MDEFRTTVARYTELDNRIRQLNKEVLPLREQRKIVELELVDILKTPAFAQTKNFQFQGSTFTAKEPGTWRGTWYLNQSDLRNDLVTFWTSGKPMSSESCFDHIVEKVRWRTRATEWQITRRVPENE
jgi:hypothetical protein